MKKLRFFIFYFICCMYLYYKHMRFCILIYQKNYQFTGRLRDWQMDLFQKNCFFLSRLGL